MGQTSAVKTRTTPAVETSHCPARISYSIFCLISTDFEIDGDLRRDPNLEILKNQDCRHFEKWSLTIFTMSGRLGSIFKTFEKHTPIPGRGSALGRRRRRRMGVYFPNVLKTDPNFPDILKMDRLQFSKCLQSWFFKISRFRPRRKSPTF